jgi:hypothetical protein
MMHEKLLYIILLYSYKNVWYIAPINAVNLNESLRFFLVVSCWRWKKQEVLIVLVEARRMVFWS